MACLLDSRTTVSAGDRKIGRGAPCFIAAEVGLNHNGDLGRAHAMIDAAAAAGVDGVKFQNFLTEDFIGDRSITYEYTVGGTMVTESQYEMFKRHELPAVRVARAARPLRARAASSFFSTPTSEQGVSRRWCSSAARC